MGGVCSSQSAKTQHQMAKIIKIKKGLNIPMTGVMPATPKVSDDSLTSLFAVTPDDFPGYTWKLAVKVGDAVKVGSKLLYAKECDSIALTSPVAGTVEEIHRGERRHIEFVSVKRQAEQPQEDFSSCSSTIEKMKLSGLFAYMRQRPFDIVPDANITPRDIFVTGFDSAPLAQNLLTPYVVEHLERGLSELKKMTSGNVYLSLPAGSNITSNVAETYIIEGPHPAGNVGTQIANIAPVNKGETVWTLDVVTAARIGELAATGRLNFATEVALTGPDVKEPHIVKTFVGAKLSTLLNNELVANDNNTRVISGNVLTGIKVNIANDFLHFPYRQITAIEEGDNADEFMGWASLSPKKYSVKRLFPSFLSSKPFNFDARIKGGHRAMIMSGEYDKVFPMDIYPEFLLKAIIAKNIEKMEERGIYEVAPEDFALAEFVDTSKLELQHIVREGLNYLRKETM